MNDFECGEPVSTNSSYPGLLFDSYGDVVCEVESESTTNTTPNLDRIALCLNAMAGHSPVKPLEVGAVAKVVERLKEQCNVCSLKPCTICSIAEALRALGVEVEG